MRAVAQRVRRARVEVEGETVGEMQEGLLALVGVARGDGPSDARQLAAKLVNLRIFEDAEGRMNLSLLETGGCLGVVSQFTLLGDARKGRRPAFSDAAPPEQAEGLVEAVIAEARNLGTPVITGRFQAHMDVELLNEGPVTILLDTERRF
ncbi:MAG: D-tyrosyl-tRNA(Tyr) deacylase [bacterium]|nr:D-tyrosyl-tRNA(Tyr) deacylase [bacterium]